MEIKKTSTRWRPKKDFWELKSKIAKEAAENKWKLGRGRPKKQKNIDSNIDTKILNHHYDISVLEKEDKEIYEDIDTTNISTNDENTEFEEKNEKYSKVALVCSAIFFIFAIAYYFISSHWQNSSNLKLFEINNSEVNNLEKDVTQMQIWYNDKNWDFVEIESIEINNDNEWITNNIEWTIENKDNYDGMIPNEIDDNSDVALIRLFYDKINNKEFSELSKITDQYLKSSGPYKTYFNSNRLTNFLDKVAGNKVFVWWFTEVPSDKPSVKHYWYIVKYKLNNESAFRQENWEIAIVERNWERLIWSIMCVTTWCSRMPFFQK